MNFGCAPALRPPDRLRPFFKSAGGARTRLYERRIQAENRKVGADKFFVDKGFQNLRQNTVFDPTSKATVDSV